MFQLSGFYCRVEEFRVSGLWVRRSSRVSASRSQVWWFNLTEAMILGCGDEGVGLRVRMKASGVFGVPWPQSPLRYQNKS